MTAEQAAQAMTIGSIVEAVVVVVSFGIGIHLAFRVRGLKGAVKLMAEARAYTALNISRRYDEEIGKAVADCGVAECPNCGALAQDFDGFGMIRCACGFCAHPSRDGYDLSDEPVEGMRSMRCNICGDIESEPIELTAGSKGESNGDDVEDQSSKTNGPSQGIRS